MEDRVLEIAGLDSGIGLILGDFFPRRNRASLRPDFRVLVRAGRFLPGGPAEAAVVIPERGVRLGSGVDAGAYASAYGTSMAHV